MTSHSKDSGIQEKRGCHSEEKARIEIRAHKRLLSARYGQNFREYPYKRDGEIPKRRTMIVVKLTDKMLERYGKVVQMFQKEDIDQEQLFIKTAEIIGVRLQ